jgi:ankyrin repeat protein
MNTVDRVLIDAASENNLAEVSRLLSVGADVNAKDRRDRTPLHWASENGHVQVVKELLDHFADIDAKDNRNWTPLLCAGASGHVAVGQALLSRGASIDAKDRYGNSPLHMAAVMDHLAVVKSLLSGGADMLAANNSGRLPIHLAVSRGRSEVSKCLLQQFYATIRRFPLHALLKDLTWIGDPNSNILVVPPLRAALHRNMLGTDDVVEILEFLVSQNSELLTSRDEDGSLPLHVACRRGAAFTVVQSLVDLYEASVESVTPQGDLPLFLACDIPEPCLDSIFLLMKLYPDVIYR